jgi:hypothetical protein
VFSNNKIIVACKEAPERLPPVLSLVSVLCELGYEVFLVTNKTSVETKQSLEGMGIHVVEGIPNQREIKGLKNVWGRMKSWITFRTTFWMTHRRLAGDTYLWVATADSALAIGRNLLDHQYVLGLLELYDQQKLYLRLLRPFIKNASHVVTPEASRSAIFRSWYDLPYTPTVLPNKPYGLDCHRRMIVTNPEAKAKLEQLGDRKLILYQARMVRMETFDVAEAIKTELGDGYVLGILGEIRDKAMFCRLRAYYPELIHFNYLRPPEHLAVTSHAYIGLIVYNYESLNNIFCAPNKVWEYGAIGLPMLSNDLPMLSSQLKYFRAGETFKSGDTTSIATAIRNIERNYEVYREGAEQLFHSVDLNKIIEGVLSSMKKPACKERVEFADFGQKEM